MTEHSLQPCDLVMQGAVASGVVYPPVVLKLKDHYRFRSIGGTSAGAIAAAGAAAAEYGREGDSEDGGFKGLKKLSDRLSDEKGFLRNLFQPSPDTRPLMNVVDAIFPPYQPPQEGKQAGNKPSTFQSALQVAGRLISNWARSRYFPPLSRSVLWGSLIGFLPALFLSLAVFWVISLFTPESIYVLIPEVVLLIVFGLPAAWLGLQIGGVVGAINKLPQNFYGICTGRGDTNALIDWLSDQLNQLAGMKGGKLLTFGDLRTKEPQNGQDAGITLKMVTSNLSQGQPYLLPSGLKGFLFKEDDMRKLFRGCVVKHMVDFAAKSPIIPNDKLPEGYHFLPDEDDLPVVVAMRLSLSFPILLSAIPLYTIKPSAITALKQGSNQPLQESDMQRNWFSDGGICDNFPIEFFDIWLPTQPTFGISLTSMPTEAFVAVPGKPETQFSKDFFSAPIPNNRRSIPDDTPVVYLPKADAPPTSQWHQLEGIGTFLSAILGTGLGWYRTLQTNLPSYRDRVVQIRLDEAEGGLHLNMPQKVIEGLVTKGSLAGDLLIPGNDPKKFNFAYHEWVRYRVLVAKLEDNFEKMRQTLQNPVLRNPLTQPINDYPYPPPNASWLTEANARLQALESLLKSWQAGTPGLFRKDEPQPETVLRVTPEV